MDPVTLAATVTTLLVPFMTKVGQNIAEEAGKGLWNTILERFRDKPAASGAAIEFESKAENPYNQEAFKLQLIRILEEDPGFMEELANLLDKAQEGEGGSVIDKSIRFGDMNTSRGSTLNLTIGDRNIISETSAKYINRESRGKNRKSKK